MNEIPQYSLKSSQKLKVLTFLVLCFLFCQNVYSQFTWQRTYEKNYQLIGNDICQTTDGNFIIAGTTLMESFGYVIFAMKINTLGDTVWTKTIIVSQGENNTATAITETIDGGAIITGRNDSAYTCKINNNGIIQWYRNYPLYYRDCYDILKTIDNGFIICGNLNNEINKAFIYKVDSNGTLIWEKQFSSPFLKLFYSLVVNGTGYSITGIESNFAGDRNQLIILNLNSNGDSLWQKNYYINNKSSSGHEIFKLGQNLYIGGGTVDSGKAQLMFMKTDINGDSLFVRRFPVNSRDEFITSFNLINNNRFVFGYERDSSFGLSLGAGMIADSNGNIIYKKVFTNSSFVWGSLRALVPLNNNDIIFAGTAQLYPSLRVVYAVRTDSMLNVPEYIGIISNAEIIAKEFILFQNYPNPFNGNTVIKYELKKKAKIKIEIYDILGRQVEILFDNNLQAGRYEYNWKPNNYSSGTYFLNMKINNQYLKTIKMLLIK